MSAFRFDAEEFFRDYGIRFITEGTKHCQDGWIQIPCPFCSGNTGHHLGYNLASDFFNCWRCGFHPTNEVVRHFAGVDWGKVKTIIGEYKARGRSLLEKKEVAKAEKVVFPSGTGPLKKRHTKYLRARGFDAEKVANDWDLLGTGPVGKYKHRIIAPIYYHGSLVSYQGRDYTDRAELKYKACRQDQERIDHKRILYGYDQVPGDTAVLVEGITDVWRLGPGAVASFGIKTKPSQILLLAEKFRRVYVLFDDDPQAIVEAEKIGFDLDMCGVTVDLCYIDGDPGALDQKIADKYMEKLL